MKKQYIFSIVIAVIASFCFSCKKENTHNGPEKESRQFVVNADGSNKAVYLNGSNISYGFTAGYVDAQTDDVVTVHADTSHYGTSVVPTMVEIKVFNKSTNALVDVVRTESALSQNVSYTIK